MTDQYPPFRLDLGGTDPASPPAGEVPAQAPTAGPGSAGRVIGAVAGALVLLVGLGMTAGGGTLLWLDGQRGADGYVSTPVVPFSDAGYALRFDANEIAPVERNWLGVDDIIGRVRVDVSGVDSGRMFVGVARTSDVATYLGDVPYGRYTGPRSMPHAAPMMQMRPPGMLMNRAMWVASASGTGKLTINWVPQAGDWSLVVMNASATRDVRADMSLAATAPHLRPVASAILVGGIGLLIVGSLVLVFATRRRPRGD